MTDNTQPEAREFTMSQYASKDCMIGAMRERIADLEAQLEAIGAGGVSGPLLGQPQAMPDLSQLTERGAKAWAGVDAQGLRGGGADMSKEREAFIRWHMDYLLTDEMLAAHVWDSQHRIAAAWQARASLSANAGELFGWVKQSEIDSSKQFGGSINLWRRRYDCDVPVYLAAPPTAQAEGWMHDCAALMANDVELWIDACPHCGKPRMHATQAAHTSPPEGMVMVPKEPTEAMRAAAVKYANGSAVYKNVNAEVLRIEEGIYGEVYEAMIAAAPLPPTSAEGVEHG